MAEHLTREELYERVWASPVSKVASNLGISGPGLAKRCKRQGIPLPPRGYWARVRAGRIPPKPPLPAEPVPQPPTRAKEPADSTGKGKRAATVSAAVKPVRRPRYRSRLRRDDRLESFWCKVERWQRSYSFGVNWRPWEMNEESWSEYDSLTLFGSIRSKTSRPYRSVEVSVLPTHVSRDKINRELEAIGNVWPDRQRKGWLLCSALVPADAFYSLCDAVVRDSFPELIVKVRNLSRGRASTSGISLHLEQLRGLVEFAVLRQPP